MSSWSRPKTKEHWHDRSRWFFSIEAEAAMLKGYIGKISDVLLIYR